MVNAKVLNFILAGVMLFLIIKLNIVLKDTNRQKADKSFYTIPFNYSTGDDETDDDLKQEAIYINNFNNQLRVYPESWEGVSDTVSSTHQAWVSLTVAESKRLIAKGLMKYPPFKERLKKGQVIVNKGTTNTYIAEELLNETLNRGEYVLGHILPEKGEVKLDRSKSRQELVIKDGVIKDIPYNEALDGMNEGDIVLKGASIINYKKGQAGVLIGHPTGGTTGVIVPKIRERNLRLIIPVGLEKESSQDIHLLNWYTKIPHEPAGKKMPFIWSIEGELFTEIEAIKQFANVDVLHIASGGIGGAEGAVTICIRGEQKEVEKALEIINSIQGEPAFVK